MKNKTRLKEILKNIIIAALSLSAVYLLFLAMNTSPAQLYKQLLSANEKPAASNETQNAASTLSATPYTILLTDEHGAKYAAKYDNDAKQKLYAQLSVTLGEALGSAIEPEKISETEWRTALKNSGVFLDYLYPQPLSLIAGQLGAAYPESLGDPQIRRLNLSVRGGYYYLHYKDAVLGEYYRLKTALEDDSLAALYAANTLPTASFAFESGASPDPYFVYSGERLIIPSVQPAIPSLTDNDILAAKAAFAMNERTGTYYSENDGSIVYVDNLKNLRVSPSGAVIFSVSGDDGIPVKYSGEAPTRADCVNAAATLISKTISPTAGDAEIVLTATEGTTEAITGAGGLTLSFCYYVNGTPTNTVSGSWCARIKISGGKITRAELIYRTYTVQSGVLVVLPEKQAAIEAANLDGTPQLFYTESGGEITAKWYNNR